MPSDIELVQILIGGGGLIALTGFAALGDLTQKVVAFPRAVVGAVWRARFFLMTVALGAIAAGLYLGLDAGVLTFGQAAGIAAIFGVIFYAGFVNIPYVMLRTDSSKARFVGHQQAASFLADDAEIAVVEVGGKVRGYPIDWITRPHVIANAGDRFGVDDVVMTYCALSHAAIAFAPQVGGRKLDLAVAGQLSNNLMLYDRRSNRLVQQLFGSFGLKPGNGAVMRRHATRIMSYRSYRTLFPGGRVYFNPPSAPFRGLISRSWDRIVRAIMKDVLDKHYDPATDRPYFPTIPRFDDRLKPKAFVHAFDIDGDRVAYTTEFLKANGGRIDTVIGGEPTAIVHFTEHGFVDAFRTGGRAVGDIGPNGDTKDGERLERQPMIPEIFWMVWAHYFPDTDLNRL